MDFKGKVFEIGETKMLSETFQKRDLIVEYAENPTYPEYVKVEFINDKCDLADDLKVGDEVDVHFNLRGRAWTDKTGKVSYFNSLVCWRINKVKDGDEPSYEAPANVGTPGADDDLPF